MTLEFACVHGHSLQAPAEIGSRQKLLCPFCGSIIEIKRSGRVSTPDKLVLTVVPTSMADGVQSGAWSAASEKDATPQLMPTEDIEPPGDEYSGPVRKKERKELQPPSLPGYEVMEELGRGGMGVVYQAYDERHGRDVALKTLQKMSPDDLVRFKQEFRALADIAHPNLASLYELLSDGQTWCFTMEILKGVEFLDYVWSEFDAFQLDEIEPRLALPPDDTPRLSRKRLNRLYDAMKQLAVGLHHLHRAGKLHSDIKPSNTIMSCEGRLVLLDFGLISEISVDDSGRLPKLIQGTPHYMAPEQAACRRLTAASDWYAVGVMLYEALTGRLPLVDSPERIMLRKQYEMPLEPRERQNDVPDELNDLCMALLETNPRNRPSAVEVLRAVDAEDEAQAIIAAAPVTAVTSVDLVGRESHLAVLEENLQEVAAGNTRSVFVHGRSGMGKSSLIEAFIKSVGEKEQAVVLAGRCYEQESVPFKALDSLIDALALFLASLSDDDERRQLPTDSLPLTRLFPVLEQMAPVSGEEKPSIDNAEQPELRQRAMASLREMLTRLGRHQPLVLYIDDLQWGDEDSANLLADLVRPPESPRLLLVGSYRREDVDSSPSLLALSEAYQRGQVRPHRFELAVDPLSHTDAMRLALELLGRSDTAAKKMADRIAQESGGSPFFVWELARHVQEDSSLELGSLDLDEVIWSRVRRLPEDTRRLLEVFAVSGRPMRASEAYQAIDVVTHGPSLLAQLRTGNFIRTTEQDGETIVESYHDRMRESVVNHLANAKVRGHHLKLALVIEQASGINVADVEAHIRSSDAFEIQGELFAADRRGWQRLFDLAYFFDAAGKSDRALPYALVAAEKAWSQNALDVAEQQYEIARRGAEAADAPLRFRIAEGFGDVLMWRGKYQRAGQQFEMARSLAKATMPLARIDGKLGFLAFKKGDMAAAAKHLEKGLSELGNPPPGNMVTQTAAMLKEAIVQLGHTVLPAWFVGRRKENTAQCRMDLARVRLYEILCYAYWFKRGVVPTLWTHLRQLNLAERYPISEELGRACSFHAISMTAIPMSNRGIRYAERSYQVHGTLGDKHGQGKARSYQTFAYISLGQFRQGVESGREAVDLLEQVGDVWEANMARLILTVPLHYLGDLQTAYQQAKIAHRIGTETGDHSAMAMSLTFWLPNSPHTVPDGMIQSEVDRPREDPLSKAVVIQGRGLELLLREDQPDEAAKVFQQSLDVAKERGLRNVVVFSNVTWKATALRMVAQREPDGPQRHRALGAARKGVRAALKCTKSYRQCRPQALRERAILAAMEGQQTTARRYFEESLRVGREQEARYEVAQSLLAYGEAGETLGWTDAQEQRELGRKQMQAMETFDV